MRTSLALVTCLALASACTPAQRTCTAADETAVFGVFANPALTSVQKAEQLAVIGVDTVSCVLSKHSAGFSGSAAGSAAGSGSGSGSAP
jgi:hypothetical protein